MTLTTRGETLVAHLERDHERLARALFAAMSHEEFESFADGLTGVIHRLRAHLAAGDGTYPR